MTLERRMNRHLESLFAGAQDTLEHRELKEEIRSNLAARIHDYLAEGMSEEQAFQTAIQYMDGSCVSVEAVATQSMVAVGGSRTCALGYAGGVAIWKQYVV